VGIRPMVTVCSLEEEGKKFGVRLTPVVDVLLLVCQVLLFVVCIASSRQCHI